MLFYAGIFVQLAYQADFVPLDSKMIKESTYYKWHTPILSVGKGEILIEEDLVSNPGNSNHHYKEVLGKLKISFRIHTFLFANEFCRCIIIYLHPLHLVFSEDRFEFLGTLSLHTSLSS